MKQHALEGLEHGVAAGFIASLCCLGPIVLSLLGLGVLFGLTGLCFIELRLPFISLGLVFVTFSALLHFRDKTCVCAFSLRHKVAYTASALVSMLLVYGLIFWFFVPFLLSFSGSLTCVA